MKKIISSFFILFLLITSSYAGTIKGVVSDKQTNELLVGVTIIVSDASDASNAMITGTSTDLDGNYSITLDPGNYKLTFSYVAYDSQEFIFELGDETIEQNVQLLESGIILQSVEVTAKVSRESENILLMDQKKAAVSVESIGAKQLSAQGVSDAASGVTKVTGITKQSGSYTINVRGLGDRYNTTTMNNLPLPSNHAEYKNINLELFSTDIISNIGVEKIFTSKLYGDVGGANINIVSKEFNEDPYLKIKIGSGFNTNLFAADHFYMADGPGFMGFDRFNVPAGEYAPTDYDLFENKWNPIDKSINPNIEGAINGGKSFSVSENSSINLFANFSYDNDYGYTEKIDNRVNGSDDYRMELKGEEFWYNTQTTGMINLNFSSPKHKIFLNSLALNSSKQTMNQLNGWYIDIVGDKEAEEAFVRRSNYERNLILVNQLLGEHELKNGFNVNWGVSYNTVENLNPDRRHNVLVHQFETGMYTPSLNDDANNHRYFHELDEKELAANIELSKTFGNLNSDEVDYFAKLALGYNGRLKEREFAAYQYNHRIQEYDQDDNLLPLETFQLDPYDIDGFFNNDNIITEDNPDGLFSLRTFYSNLNLPVTYSGLQRINAGYFYSEFNFSEKFLAVLGVRAEQVYQYVDFKTTLKTGENDFDKFYFLPSLSLRYKTTERSNLRLSASQTYTLPQFKERAPIQFEGITFSSIGNEFLYPSTNYNVDLKYEFFPKAGELISASIFGKYIQDPINQFVMSSASNDFTFANTGDWAYVYGLELDFRKDIFNNYTPDGSNKLYVGANLSLMKTEQELNNEKVEEETTDEYGRSISASFVTDRDELQGAAPILGNAYVGYEYKWNDALNSFNANLVYGYTSERLFLLGYAGEIGNQIDESYSDLDLILSSNFNKLGISFKMMNIINPNQTRIQRNKTMDHIVLQYREGLEIGLSVSYKL
jgi:hypothetical protein